MSESIRLYMQQYRENGFERAGLFKLLLDTFGATSCLYPGSFVHCTPAFYFKRSVFVDTDDRAVRFFKSSSVRSFIENQTVYSGAPAYCFHHMSYEGNLPEEEKSFDLLLSLYAGFISPTCTRYLKIGGHIVANNSHGDASMASLNSHLQFTAAIHARDDRYRLETADLDRYFVPIKSLDITPAYLRKMGRGVGYTKPAQFYAFERIK